MKSKCTVLLTAVLMLAVIAAAPLAAFDKGVMIERQVPYDLSNNMGSAVWWTWEHAAKRPMELFWAKDNNIYFDGVRAVFRVPAEGGMIERILPLEGEPDNYISPSREGWSQPIFATESSSVMFYNRHRTFDDSFECWIASYDMATGETDSITVGSNFKISASGRFLVYHKYIDVEAFLHQIILHNLETGIETILDEGSFYGHCITPDESSVIYSKAIAIDNYQLFKVSLNGGEPVQLTFYEGGVLGKVRYHPEIHPEGNLIVYTDSNYDEEYTEILTYESANGDGYATSSWRPLQPAVFNMATARTMYLFEYDFEPGKTFGEQCGYFRSHYGVFSPDGTQICYTGSDADKWGEDGSQAPFEMYIYDFVAAKYSHPTAVAEDTPESFMTVSNFPNPFNPTTTISLDVPETGFAELHIYNIAGQKVRTLVSGELSAGAHQIVWDGCNNQGTPVSSGVFVSQLSSGGNVVTNRMTLVR